MAARSERACPGLYHSQAQERGRILSKGPAAADGSGEKAALQHLQIVGVPVIGGPLREMFKRA